MELLNHEYSRVDVFIFSNPVFYVSRVRVLHSHGYSAGHLQIQLVIGPDTGISVGWQKHGKKNACSADVKV